MEQSVKCGAIPHFVSIENVLCREQTVQGPASIGNWVSFTQFRLQSDDKGLVHEWRGLDTQMGHFVGDFIFGWNQVNLDT